MTSEQAKWRAWLVTFLTTVALLGSLLFVAVVLIDPFATGRFTPIKWIDFASNNPRLMKAGLVRDRRFDAAIFGSSTGYPLDPQEIGNVSGWRVAQLAIPATLPPNQLRVARAFQRAHSDRSTLQIYVLDHLWCRRGDPNSGGWGAFPEWIYESSDAEYLSRILFPESVKTAAQRVALWLGLSKASAREDGFISNNTVAIPRARLFALQRPSSDDGVGKDFPALDLLASHIAALPADTQVLLAFAPPFLSTLPVAGSPADARMQECKMRTHQILDGRQNSAWLDLMNENEISRNESNYFDEVHYTPPAGSKIAAAVVAALRENGLSER